MNPVVFLGSWLAVAFFAPAGSASVSPQDSIQEPDLAHGELLLAQKNCFACHQTTEELVGRVQPIAAPRLDDVGRRMTAEWIQAWLLSPSVLRRGTHMPDFLEAWSPKEGVKIASELTHYLVSQTGTFEPSAVEVSSEAVANGEQLFRTLGCLPCHSNSFVDRQLAMQYSISGLAEFLQDPLRWRPSGEMPDMNLSAKEAYALSVWMLRDQLRNTEEKLVPGLHYTYLESDHWPSSGEVDWSEFPSVAEGTAELVHSKYGLRKEHYGLIFEGILQITTEGDYHFATKSDDGSELFIDGNRVVENLGHHGPIRRNSKAVHLKKGQHAIRITFFEESGGEELSAGWSGPDFESREFEAGDLWHIGQVPQPMNSGGFQVDLAAAERGKNWFGKFNCQACHPMASADIEPLRAKSWEELDPQSTFGCVSDPKILRDPPHPNAPYPSHPPSFDLSVSQRASLQALLRDDGPLSRKLTADQEVRHGMARLQCDACHSRDGVGGPTAEMQANFTSVDDVGDEGRLPPDLTDSGAKFREDWLQGALANGAKIRPSMVTRMPGFGATSQPLADAISRADYLIPATSAPTGSESSASNPQPNASPEFDPETAKLGQQLVGNRGMSCIICHGAAGYPSVGVQGPDLATMYARLRPEWFMKWMRNPTQMRPGTRMPGFWFDGKSAITDVLQGHAEPQLNSIWQYLSLGKSMPLPAGLVVDRSVYDLVPQERAIYFGTFMKGLSARVLAVGFPERLHLAFDADHVRLGLMWQGDFLNARGTWEGRAGQLEYPVGQSVQAMPAGAAFAFLNDVSDPWPTGMGKPAGWRMKGHKRTADGHPTFLYQHGPLRVEEHLQPRIAPGESGFQRSFTVTTTQPEANLYLRIAASSSIDIGDDPPDAVRSAITADGLQLSIPAPGAFLRSVPGGQEILIPMVFLAAAGTFQAHAEVTLSW